MLNDLLCEDVGMWRLRLLLLPFGAVAELLFLAAAWTLTAVGATKKAQALHDWAVTKLPSLDWYIGE